MRVVVLGLSLSSSWGNGHATTWRALLRAMAARGHEVLFLEREQPWYAEHRDLLDPAYCALRFYGSVAELEASAGEVASADLVMVGSYVPDGEAVAAWVQQTAAGLTAFYDIDTPVTLAALARDRCGYLTRALVPRFDLYLSFTGGSTLQRLEREFGARRARALYCAVDADAYRPTGAPRRWDLGYLGTYGADRQPALEQLLIEAARRDSSLRCVVAGPQYPDTIDWPANVERIQHVAPADHPDFYSSLGWTLNATRADMRAAGYSPSVRLFEAAACGCPMVSDSWPGLDELFAPGREIVTAATTEDTLAALALPEAQRVAIGRAARDRVLAGHTAVHRAVTLEAELAAARDARQGLANDTVQRRVPVRVPVPRTKSKCAETV